MAAQGEEVGVHVYGALEALGRAVDALEQARPEALPHVADSLGQAAEQLRRLLGGIKNLCAECAPQIERRLKVVEKPIESTASA